MARNTFKRTLTQDSPESGVASVVRFKELRAIGPRSRPKTEPHASGARTASSAYPVDAPWTTAPKLHSPRRDSRPLHRVCLPPVRH
jgi:hypothetical protein